MNKSTGKSRFCAGNIATTTCCWWKGDIMVRDNTSATQNTRFTAKGISGLYFLICFTHSAISNKRVINYIIKIFPVRYPNSFFSFQSSSISLVHTKLNKIHSPIHWRIRVSVQHAIDAALASSITDNGWGQLCVQSPPLHHTASLRRKDGMEEGYIYSTLPPNHTLTIL